MRMILPIQDLIFNIGIQSQMEQEQDIMIKKVLALLSWKIISWIYMLSGELQKPHLWRDLLLMQKLKI